MIKHRKKLSVELMNPEVVDSYLSSVGEFAAVCYDTDTSEVNPEAIAKHCLGSGHWSPGRATFFIFKVKGISRSCTHQIVRHSVGVEINQRSQRYVNESMPAFIVPESVMNTPFALPVYLRSMDHSWRSYRELLSFGIPGDDAREVLPNACESEMNIAFTPQALIHFCNERHCSRASWQIRALSEWLARLVIARQPWFAKHLVPKCERLGYCPEAKSCGRKKLRKDVIA